jgi:hypothetical protein
MSINLKCLLLVVITITIHMDGRAGWLEGLYNSPNVMLRWLIHGIAFCTLGKAPLPGWWINFLWWEVFKKYVTYTKSVSSEVVTAVTIKSTRFWYGKSSCLLLAWLTLWPWRWR